MRGSIDWQITEVFKSVNNLGTSKHQAKALARAEGAKTWEQVGQSIGIHGKETYNDYVTIAKNTFRYIQSEFGCKDLTRVEGYMIQSFLLDKIENGGREGKGIERATYDKYSAALHKFELALNRYSTEKTLGREYNFGLKEVSKFAAKELGARCADSRAYKNVDRLVTETVGKYHFLATILRETGFRISEGASISASQLKGMKQDPHDHRDKYWISAVGKGGKIYERPLSEKTYRELEKIISEKGRWHCNKGNFREELKLAAARSNQNYEGPHGIRWSVAQERHAELQRLGYSYESSLKIVSSELNHIRGDITTRYLH